MPKYKQEMKPVFFQQWDSHLTEKCHVPVFTIPMSLLGARIKSFNDIIQQLSTDILAPCAGSLQAWEIITAQKDLKRSKSKRSKRNKNVSIKHLNVSWVKPCSHLMKDGASRRTAEQRSRMRLPLLSGSLLTYRSEVTREAARVLGISRAAMASLHKNSLMLERSTFLPSPSLRESQTSLKQMIQNITRLLFSELLLFASVKRIWMDC